MRKQLYALALCLLLTVFPLTAFAEEEPVTPAPKLTISCVCAEDNTLTVTVGMQNNPGIAGVDLALKFNSAVLTPSVAPEMAEGWTQTVTNYDVISSGNTLKIVSAREENDTGNKLFTAVFTVKDSGDYGLSVSGTACACAETTETLIELLPVYTDEFSVSMKETTDGVTATVASYGNGYQGDAKAILACYQGERFVGCAMKDITVIRNGKTIVTFDSFPSDGTFKLLLVTPEGFVPLAEPTSL